jgi:phosphatidylglycerol---prolipoprotein diacylglyceryl transferase
VPIAVLAFDFDPLLRIGDVAVSWETVGIAAAIFMALILAGTTTMAEGFRADDLLFVVLGVVPGAVVGGRLGYVLLQPEWFLARPARIVDPSTGSAELTLAVLGGTVAGILVAGLLDGRPARWLQVATLPAFMGLAAGKLAMVLGGSGQGLPTTSDPATVYLGAGPWGSLGPGLPSVPSQALEGIATLLLVIVLLLALLVPAVREADGRAFFLGLAAWCGIRFVVAGTWRDAVTIGPLRTEQVITLIVGLGSLLAAALVSRRVESADVAVEAPTA